VVYFDIKQNNNEISGTDGIFLQISGVGLHITRHLRRIMKHMVRVQGEKFDEKFCEGHFLFEFSPPK